MVEVDADINDRGAVAAKRFGQLCRIGNDLCGWIRYGTPCRRWHSGDRNENKCGFAGIKLNFCHGTLWEKICHRTRGYPRFLRYRI